ncbi:MAG: chemotaxis protein CheA [Alphaproteobacteria bacterium]|nr:chemotaxis protein CheA [Alphaproteobacteria bacterium]
MDPMDAIKATYFQECDELLGDLEQGLLALELGTGDSETVNAVFRAVHSVKGGAGAFGFEELVTFAHVFETALDDLRSGRRAAEPALIKTMLRAADVLADFVVAARNGTSPDEARGRSVAQELAMAEEPAAPIVERRTDEFGFAPVVVEFDLPALESTPSPWQVRLQPLSAMYAKGHDAILFLRELGRLGEAHTTLIDDELPPFDQLDPDKSYLRWEIELPADVDRVRIEEIFDFVGDDCLVSITQGAVEPATSTPAAIVEAVIVEAPSAPQQVPLVSVPLEQKADVAAAAAASPTIRVDLDRVDRMIDLVGELVINQAMIAQRVTESGIARSSAVAIGLEELEHLTREIQDSVMAIRAQPVRSVFQRMPRLVREISAATGKLVRLVTDGEATEVDKTVIERLSDPITHMLRNAIDHGLEGPDQRLQAGKPAEGVVRLAACHRSGRIVIEVSDDGKGIDRPRVRDIAIAKGLIAPEAQLTDEEADNLIFLPGFSTAAAVSNISGRGVGMDVVKRSIQALGGRIAISSKPGQGSTFTMSLPLTLAVLDGMVVSVAGQTYVAPLTAVLESLQPKPADIRRIGPQQAVLSIRGAHVPLIDVAVALGLRDHPIDPATGIVLLVESEIGGRAAMVVEAIHGQRQVVIKSLEANYRHVNGIAAATILGDGRVALILDVDTIIEHQAGKAEPMRFARAS